MCELVVNHFSISWIVARVPIVLTAPLLLSLLLITPFWINSALQFFVRLGLRYCFVAAASCFHLWFNSGGFNMDVSIIEIVWKLVVSVKLKKFKFIWNG